MTLLEQETLFIRKAGNKDVPAISELSRKVYGDHQYTEKQIKAHLRAFPQGQFVAESEGKVIGYCGTFRVNEDVALKPHSWNDITANGYLARHNQNGDMLYGFEIFVDPDSRRQRIGQRFYDARRDLCEELELKGIVFCGRMPQYAERKEKFDGPEDYVRRVERQEVEDSVILFQLRNGFEIKGVFKDYLKEDKESDGSAVVMVWYNPLYEEDTGASGKIGSDVRIASVQFQVRKVSSFDDFMSQIEYFVDIASDYRADFVTFPELFTLALLSAEQKKMTYGESVRRVSEYTDEFIKAMREMAVSYNVNIIGGSHPRDDNGLLKNTAYVFLRNGEVYGQDKIHPTPIERDWWGLQGGDDVEVIETDCGPIGVMICYDSEFPEIARHLADQGALILFVPFCTDMRQGYLRVNYCCQARAVENQLYVVSSGVVGNLPDVENMDIHYAESHIYTPVDFPFSRDGIAASSESNTEMIIFADVSIDDLLISRQTGTVQNFKDRRLDLYAVKWRK